MMGDYPEDFVAQVGLIHRFGKFKVTRYASNKLDHHPREEEVTPDEAMTIAEFIGAGSIEFVRTAVAADLERARKAYEGSEMRRDEAQMSVTHSYVALKNAEETVKRLCGSTE